MKPREFRTLLSSLEALRVSQCLPAARDYDPCFLPRPYDGRLAFARHLHASRPRPRYQFDENEPYVKEEEGEEIKSNEQRRALSAEPADEREPITAAPEIEFDSKGFPLRAQREPITDPSLPGFTLTPERLSKLRVVPASRSYFTSKPIYTDDLLDIRAAYRGAQTLPILDPGQQPRVKWLAAERYASRTGEHIRPGRFGRMLTVLKRLNLIAPSLRPPAVHAVLSRFSEPTDPTRSRAKPIVIDEWGRARAAGRRKTSTAQVWLLHGEGEVLVNGQPLTETFGRPHDRESALWALKVTERMDKYNVWVVVKGGGTTGQAEAMTLAIGKALVVHEPLLKGILRKAGCITNDPRRVERKKPGRVKARKRPTWVKR